MNQKYKDKYEELRNSDPSKKDGEKTHPQDTEHYDTPGNSRMLSFAWPDGKKLFLNYAYLVSGELTEAEDTHTLTLTFTSHAITLKGYALEPVFSDIMQQKLKMVTETNPRYATPE
ncbi:MAG: hypothetical protein ACKO96_41825, partial [Flammeovirgaceae bacterium]